MSHVYAFTHPINFRGHPTYHGDWNIVISLSASEAFCKANNLPLLRGGELAQSYSRALRALEQIRDRYDMLASGLWRSGGQKLPGCRLQAEWYSAHYTSKHGPGGNDGGVALFLPPFDPAGRLMCCVDRLPDDKYTMRIEAVNRGLRGLGDILGVLRFVFPGGVKAMRVDRAGAVQVEKITRAWAQEHEQLLCAALGRDRFFAVVTAVLQF
jgi:hypothetical protein